jgi:alkylhydroperoxidase family enzyme
MKRDMDRAELRDRVVTRHGACFSDWVVATGLVVSATAAGCGRQPDVIANPEGVTSIREPALVVGPAARSAAAADDLPRPTPATRPVMKRLLEDMKDRAERIPLPEPTPEERAVAGDDPQALSYETRLRTLYLAGTPPRGYLGFGGMPPQRAGVPVRQPVEKPDPVLSLDYAFKTRLFWIASRTNNCQYCLGHQESKLLAVGMTDDDLARLDTEWTAFPVAEQAAFTLARRITLAPGDVSDADVEACLVHYAPQQVLEMALSVAGNNAINRWKEGIGVPQAAGGGGSGWALTRPDGVHSYLTATSERYALTPSQVAVIDETPAPDGLCATPQLPAPARAAEVRSGLARARSRTPRLPLVPEEEARRLLADVAPPGTVPAWMRLLAWFPEAGPRLARSLAVGGAPSELDPLDRALVRWAVARRNRAWYALDLAERDLRHAGLDETALADLAGDQAQVTSARRALLVVADALAASPVSCTDGQFQAALTATSPATMTRVVHEVAMESLFDRFTEAAGLPIE